MQRCSVPEMLKWRSPGRPIELVWWFRWRRSAFWNFRRLQGHSRSICARCTFLTQAQAGSQRQQKWGEWWTQQSERQSVSPGCRLYSVRLSTSSGQFPLGSSHLWRRRQLARRILRDWLEARSSRVACEWWTKGCWWRSRVSSGPDPWIHSELRCQARLF